MEVGLELSQLLAAYLPQEQERLAAALLAAYVREKQLEAVNEVLCRLLREHGYNE